MWSFKVIRSRDDLEALEAFYSGIMGLPLIGKEQGRHVFFRVGDESVLLIFNPQVILQGGMLPAHGTKGPGHFALGIRAELLDVWRQYLVEKDIEIEKEVVWPRGRERETERAPRFLFVISS